MVSRFAIRRRQIHALALVTSLAASVAFPVHAGDVKRRPANIASCSNTEYVLVDFVPHETTLRPEHIAVLDDAVSKIIKSFGYCKQPFDYVELRGYAAPWGDLTQQILQERSDARAENARQHLRSRFHGGYDEHVNMLAKGYGGTDLFGDNETESGRASNRRVMLRFCRTYETMRADIAKIQEQDFDVYKEKIPRHENRCMTQQMRDWAKSPRSMKDSVTRQAKRIFEELYGPDTEGCDPDRVRNKIALRRKELRRELFGAIEREYRDLKIETAMAGDFFASDGHRRIYATDTCEQLREFQKRAQDPADILHCFGERINDPGRFDLCLVKPGLGG